MKNLEDILVAELTKTVNNDILKKLLKLLYNQNLEERKANIRRKINLGRLLDDPPEFFKRK